MEIDSSSPAKTTATLATADEDAFNWRVAKSKAPRNKNKTNNNKFSSNKKLFDEQQQAESVLIKDAFNEKNVQLVKSYLTKNEKCMIILRGLPGSGKSTLAWYFFIKYSKKKYLFRLFGDVKKEKINNILI